MIIDNTIKGVASIVALVGVENKKQLEYLLDTRIFGFKMCGILIMNATGSYELTELF